MPETPPVADAIDPVYARKIENEREFYRNRTEVHDLPPIFHYWSNRYIRPMLEEFGVSSAEEMYAEYLARSARAIPGRAHFLSIGAGNCDAEIRVAGMLLKKNVNDFVIECLDLNPQMLERGRELAAQNGLTGRMAFVLGDFNQWRPSKQYAGVMANQALHHVVELERLFDGIREALHPEGYFVTSDMIGRNGHLRWPEAMTEFRRFWKELPVEYRWNVQLRRYEEEFQDHDCSTEGFEGIRAQDVLPLLADRFGFDLFVAFGNIVEPFVNRSFGPNFDANGEWDRDFVDRVHAADESGLRAGRISPTQMLAAMKTGRCSERLYARGLDPKSCIRREPKPSPVAGALEIATTSLGPTHTDGCEFRQTLAALGGEPPYHWSATGLPPGLVLDERGLLSGKLLRAGLFPVVCSVQDSSSPPRSAEQRYTIVSAVGEPIEFLFGPQLPGAVAGRAYSWQLRAAGGKLPFRWALASGELPEGMRLDADSGALSGTPLETTDARFTIRVTDATRNFMDQEVSLAVAPRREPSFLVVLPHIVCGGGWKTSLRLVNTSPREAGVSVRFWSDLGEPFQLPLSRSLGEPLAPFSAISVETPAQKRPEYSGWMEILATEPIFADGRFSHDAQGTAAAEFDRAPSPVLLWPYDETEEHKTGVAVANRDMDRAVKIALTAWDDEWNVLAEQELELPARGHATFLLGERIPATRARRGILQLATSSSAGISGLALRFGANGQVAGVNKLVQAGAPEASPAAKPVS